MLIYLSRAAKMKMKKNIVQLQLHLPVLEHSTSSFETGLALAIYSRNKIALETGTKEQTNVRFYFMHTYIHTYIGQHRSILELFQSFPVPPGVPLLHYYGSHANSFFISLYRIYSCNPVLPSSV